jgi:hypothetical protein
MQNHVHHFPVASSSSVQTHQLTGLAWAAGIIDGEGCLYVHKHKRNYVATLRVKMIHRPTIERLEQTFGVGTLRTDPPGKQSKRQTWSWTVSGHAVADVLYPVLPFLTTKRHEARLLLSFTRLPVTARGGGRTIPPRLLRWRDWFHTALKTAKRCEWVPQ